jgi:hypothetical protein
MIFLMPPSTTSFITDSSSRVPMFRGDAVFQIDTK